MELASYVYMGKQHTTLLVSHAAPLGTIKASYPPFERILCNIAT